jgi:tyrosine-protein kinase Etk/Wzc
MPHSQNINVQEDNDLKKISELVLRNYKLFAVTIFIALGLSFLLNRYSIPLYSISSSILIKEKDQQGGRDMNDYLNSSLFGKNQNFQNELWVIRSTPVIEQTIRNLDLTVTYYSKGRLQFYDVYKNVPFKVSFLSTHIQPVFVKFNITFLNENYFQLKAEAKKATFFNYETNVPAYEKNKWVFTKNGKFGELIETPDLSFIIEPVDSSIYNQKDETRSYGFEFKTYGALIGEVRSKLDFNVVDKLATVIRINLRCESQDKGIDIVNELMSVYSEQNLERKNHIASITIDYIEKQLNEISDSLILTEDNLQRFRSSNQLLNISDQASNISSQHMALQNQLAELVSRKKYFDYVSDLLKNNDYSNMMLPASIGVSDPLLNNLMSELIAAQAQKSNLIENNQERNPLVPKLTIQIENLKKTISENISSIAKTTNISIDELNKRIMRIEAEIKRLPATQRQLGVIERKFRLNDAIYNYLLEKHAEAKITKASNLPDDIVVEPAMGTGQISPNTRKNYLLAFFIGLAIPFGFIMAKSFLNDKIENQDDIERLTEQPVLGKILHSKFKTSNVMFDFPKADIAESFRALRTNLDFYVRGGHKKVIMVTSCLEGEGKSFIALNLAMSYAQLGRRTILVDFDLRKPKTYFSEKEASQEGLSSYMINKIGLDEIIVKSPNDKLDYILSGILPPNPVELLALDKTEILITKLKNEYDIVVLDSTPLAQVSDAYLLIEHAEVKILVTRQNYTLKKVFSLVMKDLQLKSVGNLCIVLNDNRFYNDQYGYGYGYQSKGILKRRWKKRKQKTGDN